MATPQPSLAPGAVLSDDATPAATGIVDLLKSLLSTWRRQALTHAEIGAVELRRAALSLSTMLGMAVLVGSLLSATWLLVLGLVSFWALQNGMDWRLAGALLIVTNGLATYLLWQAIRRRSGQLLFKTLRSSLHHS
ncbi:MAG: hypothetical protein ACREXT_03285 [Gammaproteobacteria bacterium]